MNFRARPGCLLGTTASIVSGLVFPVTAFLIAGLLLLIDRGAS